MAAANTTRCQLSITEGSSLPNRPRGLPYTVAGLVTKAVFDL
jgi:hypothetical protein